MDDILAEGKTKRVFPIKNDSTGCVIQSKSAITADNDPSKTRDFAIKAQYANKTICNVFELLKFAGIPVAYRKQISDVEFEADFCKMIPLEVVALRFAVGSFFSLLCAIFAIIPLAFIFAIV